MRRFSRRWENIRFEYGCFMLHPDGHVHNDAEDDDESGTNPEGSIANEREISMKRMCLLETYKSGLFSIKLMSFVEE